jgi:hypothetical protein
MLDSKYLKPEEYFVLSAEEALEQFVRAQSDRGMPGEDMRAEGARLIASLQRPKTDEEFEIFVAVIRRKLKQCYEFAKKGNKRREKKFNKYPELMEHLYSIERSGEFDYEQLYELMDTVVYRLSMVVDLEFYSDGQKVETIPLSRFKKGGKQRARYTENGRKRTSN